ncbi:hypothetical protein CMV_016746 [Castanea mollissima]|uniref:Uncharacterized protein n=1 Tax=Castanea mollissima TaxID=60419 RepID=A0A8J4QTK5_9ROSI|nr:hypothetical protein CMV_016746 [Castanea mollissima]
MWLTVRKNPEAVDAQLPSVEDSVRKTLKNHLKRKVSNPLRRSLRSCQVGVTIGKTDDTICYYLWYNSGAKFT